MDTETKAKIYKRAVELLNDNRQEADYRDDYSGRGMNGRQTPAIVTDSAVYVGWAIGQAMIDLGIGYQYPDEIMPGSDSMGLSKVFY